MAELNLSNWEAEEADENFESDTSEFEVLPGKSKSSNKTTIAASGIGTLECSVETAGTDFNGKTVKQEKYKFSTAGTAKVADLVQMVCKKLHLEESRHKFCVQNLKKEDCFNMGMDDPIEHQGQYKVHVEGVAREKKDKTCIIKIKNASSLEAYYIADLPILVETLCPRAAEYGGKCPSNECKWACDQCGEWKRVQIEKDIEEGNTAADDQKRGQPRGRMNDAFLSYFFYCSCGRAKAEEFLYRCNHADQHGDQFVPFSSEHLPGVLSRLGTFGIRNVLILGESGVGKSTWINAFANYLQYNTLQEAAEGGPICVIPSKFKEKKIEIVVSDPDRDELPAQRIDLSATIHPITHLFSYKGGFLRLIDTPGIGDTGGLDQDRKNLENIFDYIGNISEIHGICILMKPNETRLSIAFKYYLGELIAQLHISAAKNILFCFTSAQQKDYEDPGDTFHVLGNYLDDLKQINNVDIELHEDNTYFMDNEAFRYLWASKNGVEYSVNRVKQYAKNWRKSQQETHRLLDRVNGLSPHRTMETISVNNARRIIKALQKPLATATSKIQKNIAKVKDHKAYLERLDLNESVIRDKLMVEITVIECKKIYKSRIVCTADKCTTVGKNADGIDEIKYKFCESYPLGFLELLFYRFIARKCSICECPNEHHKVINYDQIEVTKRIEDEQIAQLLRDNASEQEIKQQAIENFEKKIEDLEEEQEKVNQIAAKFGAFLKQNAIVPYNDSLQGYIELSIQEAEMLGDQQQVCALKQSLDGYLKQMIIFDGPANGAQKLSLADIHRYANELTSLPLMGESIKNMLNAEKCSRQERMKYTEEDHTGIFKSTFAGAKNAFLDLKSCIGFSWPARK